MSGKFYDAKCEEITKALGATLPAEQPTYYCWCFTYRGYDFNIKPDGKKYEIHVSIPHNKYRDANTYEADEAYKEVTTSIGVSADKSVDKIVADINRRFNFDDLDRIKKLREAADDHYLKRLEEHKKIVEEIERITGIKPWNKTGGVCKFSISRNKQTHYGEILVDMTSVKFEMNYVTDMAVIQKLAKAFA